MAARLLRQRRGVTLARERIDTPDGDFLDLDWVTGDRLDRPLVLVLHGLEGSARSKYAFELYRQLASRGLVAVGLNFRSCSGELNRTARLYHSGETSDLAFVLSTLRKRFPGRPIGAAGFSLGGNVLLKYLGECGLSGADPGVSAAAAVSVPFNLAAGSVHMERGFARVYVWRLLRQLKAKTRGKAHLLNGRIDIDVVMKARTWREFDDSATAPLHGFSDADDYYDRSSSDRFVPHIRVPTRVIHALDDPFLPSSAVPIEALDANAAIDPVITPTGGHVGFLSGPPWRFWAEARVADHLARFLLAHQSGE